MTKERDYMTDAYAPSGTLEQRARRSEQADFRDDLNPDDAEQKENAHTRAAAPADPNKSPESWNHFYWSWLFGSPQPQG